MRTVRLTEETKKNILEDLLKRSPNQYKEYTEKVEAILKDVQENGDKAVFGYTEKFDKAVLTAETVRVTEEEIAEAYEKLPANSPYLRMKLPVATRRQITSRPWPKTVAGRTSIVAFSTSALT